MKNNPGVFCEYASRGDLAQIAMLHLPENSRNLESKLFNFYKDKVDLLFSDKAHRIIVARDGQELIGFIIFTENLSKHNKAMWGARSLALWLMNVIRGRYGFTRFIFVKCFNLLRHKTVCDSLENRENILSAAKIISIIVKENYRRQGVGERLVGQAIEAINADGIKALSVAALFNNAAAINFYEALGFREAGHTWESTGKSIILIKEI